MRNSVEQQITMELWSLCRANDLQGGSKLTSEATARFPSFYDFTQAEISAIHHHVRGAYVSLECLRADTLHLARDAEALSRIQEWVATLEGGGNFTWNSKSDLRQAQLALVTLIQSFGVPIYAYFQALEARTQLPEDLTLLKSAIGFFYAHPYGKSE